MSLPNPIVLLDARAKYVHPAFQMTRASTKTVFDSSGRLVTVPPNAIGWDHDPATGQARGYLAEPSATNLLLHSNDLTQSPWEPIRSSITGDAITGPDGQGMAKVVEDNSDNYHGVRQSFSITDGSDVTGSFIGKADARAGVRFYLQDAGEPTYNMSIHVNLRDGVITNQQASPGITIIGMDVAHLGRGFYFVWMAINFGPGVDSVRAECRILDDNNNSNYQGDGTSGLYLGYFQAEEGSYPTSYIETGESTATRAGDSLVLSGLGDFPWWRSERGTLLVDTDISQNHSRAGHIVMFSSPSQFLRITRNSGGALAVQGSDIDAVVLLPQPQAPGRHLIGLSWVGDESWSVGLDGSIGAEGPFLSPLGSVPSVGLGVHPGTNTQQPQGHIRRAVYYPQRLSNADLQSLTAMQE